MLEPSRLGWWCIAGDSLLAALHRVEEGADAELIYTELYANANTERVPDEAVATHFAAVANAARHFCRIALIALDGGLPDEARVIIASLDQRLDAAGAIDPMTDEL